MRVLSGFDAARGQQLAGCAVALGNFDGVHLGHQALFREAIDRARGVGRPAIAATFDPHPGKVLAPELAPKVITPLPRKLELMEALGLDAVVVQPFDERYAALSAPDFLERDLFGALAPSWVVVGPDFTFGRGRGGTVEDLRAAAALHNAGITRVDPVTCEGVVVSSTKIREFIAEGRVGAAARLLGRPFDVRGRVVHGEGRGRTFGFPTANLAIEGEVRPRNGVYAVRVFFGGAVYVGAANIGRKPTFGRGEVTVEIFLFDFEGDLYGTRMSVEFLKRLRGEQRFSSVDELARQISKDCEATRAVLAQVEPPGPLSPRG
ncbi:MAG: bifunctional riboflavin kinase/FAD synthetase [Myxococcales bacterium]